MLETTLGRSLPPPVSELSFPLVVLTHSRIGERKDTASLGVAGRRAGAAATSPGNVNSRVGFVTEPEVGRFVAQVGRCENPARAKAMLNAEIPLVNRRGMKIGRQ